MDHADRVTALRERLEREGVAALLVTSAANVRYLTGFTGEGLAVVTGDSVLLSTDGRYRVEAGEASGVEAAFHELGHLAGAYDFLGRVEAAPVAFEAEALTYGSYMTLSDKLAGVELKPARRWVEELRLVKDADEIACLRRAAGIADEALTAFLAGVRPGPTEKELALDLERELVLRGAEPSFEIIMASGENSARPHAVPGERRLREGEALKIDMGARWQGYCSDVTRTYCCGEPSAKFVEIYNIVREAQARARAQVGPGVKGADLDKIARDYIVERGYGEAFGHGLGHGIGLEVHEGPRVSSRSEDVLRPGMVVTIEPGIYLEGWGGVRIEDSVLVTDDGHEVLTQIAKPDYGC